MQQEERPHKVHDTSDYITMATLFKRQQLIERYSNLLNYSERLETFDGFWFQELEQSPAALAENGFYYVGPGDKVKCAFCKLTLSDWEKTDHIGARHKMWSSNCPAKFYKSSGYHQIQYVGPLEKYQYRLESFEENWPKGYTQSPEALAFSGLYYVGPSDLVRCYDCGVFLYDWTKYEVVNSAHYQIAKQNEKVCSHLEKYCGFEF